MGTLVDDLLAGNRALLDIGLGVCGDDLQTPSHDATGLVDLVHGDLGAVQSRQVVCRHEVG